MIHTLSTYEAADKLRQDFSREAAFALVEYYEQMEQDTGETIEFDRVAIRCDWSEFASIEEWAEENRHMERINAILADEEPEDREAQLWKEMAWHFSQYIKLPEGKLLIGVC